MSECLLSAFQLKGCLVLSSTHRHTSRRLVFLKMYSLMRRIRLEKA
ncbi:hypothetical protein D068_cds27410 [Bacillus atrophaeus UCMB-5137]|nr:hypothetical protein D068_cds27410 [Bacillus atrophaeus UCMB-5137]